MQVNDNDMDELFARKLGNMEVAPPEDGWARIENELNRRSRITRRYWLAAASFALVLSVTATMVYIQTNVATEPATIVSIRDNTSYLPQEQPSVIDDGNATQQMVNRFVTQQNEKSLSLQNENNISLVQEEATKNIQVASQNDEAVPNVRDVNSNPSASPYLDAWDELRLAKPVKVDWRKIMSDKIAQLKMEVPEKKIDETITIASTTTPWYDEISYVDFTDISTKSQPRRRWEITGQFAPVHSYRTIKGVPAGIRKSDFDHAESPLLAYSGGVNLSYRVFSRWSLQTGILYSQMGQSINSVIPVTNMYAAISSTGNPYTKNFVRTSSGSVTVASNLKSDANTSYSSYFNSESQMANANSTAANIANPAKYRLMERLDYLEIPLIVRYRIFDRKLNLYVSGGMSANVLINNNVFVDNGSEIVKGGTILMARPVNYSSMMGLGIGYQINRNLSVGFEPYFKYFLQPYTTSSQISSNPYALGVFSGVVYCF